MKGTGLVVDPRRFKKKGLDDCCVLFSDLNFLSLLSYRSVSSTAEVILWRCQSRRPPFFVVHILTGWCDQWSVVGDSSECLLWFSFTDSLDTHLSNRLLCLFIIILTIVCISISHRLLYFKAGITDNHQRCHIVHLEMLFVPYLCFISKTKIVYFFSVKVQ